MKCYRYTELSLYLTKKDGFNLMCWILLLQGANTTLTINPEGKLFFESITEEEN